MRNEMEAILKEVLRDHLLRTRYQLGLTQERMAEALVMSKRSYEYIESGDCACGALTTVLLLLGAENRDLEDELRARLKEAYEAEVVRQ